MLRIRSCLFVLTLLSPVIGRAQLLHSLAVKVAYSSAFQVFEYTANLPQDKKRINVANAGVAVQFFPGSPVALLVQCEYAERGMKDQFILTGPTGPDPIGHEYKYGRVRYVSIPVMAKIYVTDGGISTYALAGARIDFNLGSQSDDDIFKAVYDGFTRSTYGLSGGVGAEFSPLPFFLIQCEGRYNLDLKDSYNTQDLKVKNNSFDVWLGIAFVV